MINENDIILDGSTATWDMGRLEGPIGGTYTGTFKFRCYLTPTQQLAAGREYRELLGPKLELAPEHEGMLAWSQTQLKFRVLASPPFWTTPSQDGATAGDIPDTNVILAVLNAAMAAENKFLSTRSKEREQALDGAINAAERVLQEDTDHE